MKNFSLISAVALNGVIGNSATNQMPWHLPSDLKHFKNNTIGKTVVMGSNTFYSIGKCLPNRRNVVVTRQLSDGILLKNNFGVDEVYQNFWDALKDEQENFVVIGGQHIYTQALLAGVTTMNITMIHHNFDGDVKFPIAGNNFTHNIVYSPIGKKYVVTNRSDVMTENQIKFSFVELQLDA